MSVISNKLSIDNTYVDESNIITTVTKLFRKLKNNFEVLCCAEMQSGKSEVMRRIAHLIKIYPKEISSYLKYDIDITKVFIIISTSSVGLKTQLQSHIPHIAKHIYHINDINSMIESRGQFEITGRHTLIDMSMNSLIIFDECHADVELNSIIAKLRYKLDTINKIPTDRYKIIGFSATPYEQIYYGVDKVIMQPGDNYYGVKKMYKLKKIHQAYDLSVIDNIYELFLSNFIGNLYYVFRLPADKKITDSWINNIRNTFIDINECLYKKTVSVDTYIYDKDDNYDINVNLLNNRPTNPTFIFLKDKMRMGCYLNTKYIVLVHDDPVNQFAHTTVQSLLGRCCGYDKLNHSVEIYCDKNQADEHYEWIRNNFHRENIPSKVKYLKKSCIYTQEISSD